MTSFCAVLTLRMVSNASEFVYGPSRGILVSLVMLHNVLGEGNEVLGVQFALHAILTDGLVGAPSGVNEVTDAELDDELWGSATLSGHSFLLCGV